MAAKLKGKLIPSGFVVMETYNVELDIPKELQTAFEENPEKFIGQFLRENGKKVNSIQIIKSDSKTVSAKGVRRARVNHYFHIVYPARESSGWICA
jgi:hypothetical protein